MNHPLVLGNASAMVAGLLRSDAYPHPATSIELLETHISWVFLAGAYAYKVKKPVDLGFVDFTTLERRRHFCEEELRLNRRLAPQLYIDIVAIRGATETPRVDGAGPLVEYALRMQRFPQEALASRMLSDGRLTPEMLERLARKIAGFHAGLEPAPLNSPFGSCGSVLHDACQNFEQIASSLPEGSGHEELATLRDWIEREFLLRYSDMRRRHESGMTRECHGDLHLKNIALIDDELVPFDCIEFNPGLRWIDVMSEIAFLFMDLMDRGADALAWRFLNAYLEASGAYSSLSVLRFYLVYRAMVRAKVHLMRACQENVAAAERVRLRKLYEGYLALAQRCTHLGRPAVLLMHGFSGCGKSTIALSLAQQLGAIRIRSDVERKRLHDLAPLTRTRSRVSGGLYGQDTTQATYSRLAEAARAVVTSGYAAVVDATFLLRAQRAALLDVAGNTGVPIALIDVRAPRRLLRSRIMSRAIQGRDPSEASLAVLEHQFVTAEPVTHDERLVSYKLDGRKRVDDAAVSAICQRVFGSGRRSGDSARRPHAVLE